MSAFWAKEVEVRSTAQHRNSGRRKGIKNLLVHIRCEDIGGISPIASARVANQKTVGRARTPVPTAHLVRRAMIRRERSSDETGYRRFESRWRSSRAGR